MVVTAFACGNSSTNAGESSSSGGFGGLDGSTGSPSGNNSSSGNTSDGSSGTDKPPPEVFVDLTNETMEFGGRTRSYILAKPKNYDAAESYPLVMSFHGNPGDAKGMSQGLPFDSVSKKDAIIVYPQGWDNNWDLYTPTDDNNDMDFVQALVDEIKDNKANIDKAKVFGFGYSGGAFFVTQMACRFGGFFKAISVNSGGGPDEEQMGYDQRANGCYICPGGPIPTLVVHGDKDNEVKPSSGEFTANCFAKANGCDSSRSPIAPAPCQEHDGCPADNPVKWCLIPGLGHGIWVDAMKEAWSFFTAL